MYNLRYHLASLVAVFLALTLGLMLGSVVAERGYLDDQQSALVEGLQHDFEGLRSTNDLLRTEYERDHLFAEQVSDAYTEGLLEGALVLVISDGERAEALSAANAAVVGAGARVATLVFEQPGFGLDDPAVRGAVMSLDVTSTPMLDRDLSAEVVAALAAELATPSVAGTRYLDKLIEADVVSADGLGDSWSIAGTIIVASFEGVPDPVLVQLAARLQATPMPVLGAEVSQRDDGVVTASLEAGLSAVDHVELPQGALAAVMIIAGQAEGHYGLRDEASGVNPPLVR